MARKNRHLKRFADQNRIYFEDGAFCKWVTNEELEEIKHELEPHYETRPKGQHFLGYKFKPAYELGDGGGYSEAWHIKPSGGYPVWQMNSTRIVPQNG